MYVKGSWKFHIEIIGNLFKMLCQSPKKTMVISFQFELRYSNVLYITSMYKHISDNNNVLSHNRPGFRKGGLCLNQLLSTSCDIFQSFVEIMNTMNEIIKVFEKVGRKVLFIRCASAVESCLLFQLMF